MSVDKWKKIPLAVGLLIMLPTASAVLLWDQNSARIEAPTQEEHSSEWEDLTMIIRPHLKPGDILRIIPFWDAVGRTALRGTVPKSEGWPFSALDWREPADPIPWMSFDRLIRIGWRDRVDADFQAFPIGSKKSVLIGETQRLVAYATSLPPSPLRWRAWDHLPDATVERTLRNGTIETCAWNRDHHKCPGSSKWWKEIRNLRMDAGDLPRECTFIQPFPDGSRTEVTFDNVKIEPGDTVLLRAGNTIEGARKNKGSAISIELRINDNIAYRDKYHQNDYLFTPWAIRLPENAMGDKYQITLSISAQKTAWRQGCFDLQVLGPGWEQWGNPGHGAAFKESASPVEVRWFSWPARTLTERKN